MSPARREFILHKDVAHAGLVVSDRIRHEFVSQLELEEDLNSCSHPYSTFPEDWPPLAEVAETRDVPAMVAKRCISGAGKFLRGLFPDIRTAWVSVDHSLFLWRTDRRGEECRKYNFGQQAICAVGFTKLRPGIFDEPIQYLLIVANPVELILVGVGCSGSGDAVNPEISLHRLEEYTIPSDGVAMTCITCTQNGRIFMAGWDGHLYELNYIAGSGGHICCRKICLTAGVGSEILRWVAPNIFNFGAVDPIIEMVVDDERLILYARTKGMKLQVYTMGLNGDGKLLKVAEERILLSQEDAHYGGRQTKEGRTSNQSPKPTIVSISPLTTLESKHLQLLVVLSDGRRMYLSTSSVGGPGGYNVNSHQPNCLRVVTTRPPPSLGSTRSQTEDLSLKVESACYTAGTLVLYDSSPSTKSSLVIASRDYSSHSPSSSTLRTIPSSRGLLELISPLPLEGQMLCAADVLPHRDIAATVISLYSKLDYSELECSGKSGEKACIKLWAKGDISMQHILPRRKLVVFSTTGMLLVVFNRPVDILRRLFEQKDPMPSLKEFFNRFGADEAAAMCLMLAAGIVHSDNPISPTDSDKAAKAFEDPILVGRPQPGGSSDLSNKRTSAAGFRIGRFGLDAEPVFSHALEGLSLCSCRLLLPIWEHPIYVIKEHLDASTETGVVGCTFSVEAMQVLETKLRSVEGFLRSRRDQRRGRYGFAVGLPDMTGPSGGRSNERKISTCSPAEMAALEVWEMECLRQLLLRSAEALYLLQFLSEIRVAFWLQDFDEDVVESLLQLTFCQLVCSKKGRQITRKLTGALVFDYTECEGSETADDVSQRLDLKCPNYYKDSNYKLCMAMECLEKAAESASPEERERMAREVFDSLSAVPEIPNMRTVCKLFRDVRFYEAVVHLPLRKAQNMDPGDAALNEQADPALRKQAIWRRGLCYKIIGEALRSLKGEAPDVDRSNCIVQIVRLGVQSPDRLFHKYLHTTMIDMGLRDELLENGGLDLVDFLQKAAPAIRRSRTI